MVKHTLEFHYPSMHMEKETSIHTNCTSDWAYAILNAEGLMIT